MSFFIRVISPNFLFNNRHLVIVLLWAPSLGLGSHLIFYLSVAPTTNMNFQSDIVSGYSLS